ncbi:Amuc_1100 family pilus-like protein [Rubritalea tangerina]|uniref:Amuc_1100 family pilus-like protein n=2 Tax=Rubritalea tangerina TaxID=430798 RepID=A0ABW4ZFD8_9BACT
MSWIQENKFAAALAGVTLVGSGVLISLSMGKGDDFKSAKTQLKKALKQEAELQAVQPYPNQANLANKTDIVDDYSQASRDLGAKFAAYKPDAKVVEDFAPDRFSKIVSEFRERLDESFKGNDVELPERCVYGFEAYASKFPRPEATGELNYQVQATEWLLGELAKQKPEALLNVVRKKLEVESAPARPATRKNNRRAAEVEEEEKALIEMPMELTFRCTEAELSEFLSVIANTEKYPFVIRAVRVQNERMTPPTTGDARFETPAAPAADDSFGFENFVIEEDVAEGEEGAEVTEEAVEVEEQDVPEVANDNDDTRVILPILGAEKVNVFLKLDLILLTGKGMPSLDEMKKEAKIEETSNAG